MIETALSREGECSSWDGARAILDALGGDLSRGKEGVFRGSGGRSRVRDTDRERRSIFQAGPKPGRLEIREDSSVDTTYREVSPIYNR